jgi:predicted TIM-barrel enzyme
MSRYRKLFPNHHSVFTVIHVEYEEQALRNCEIARTAGADGTFLINHGISSTDLLKIHHTAFQEFPDWWIGVNCLDNDPSETFKMVTEEVAGIWVDNAMINENMNIQPNADRIRKAQEESRWQGLYFGGVDFKYQRHVNDLENASNIAMRYMDVVTTSGAGTGIAADATKIQRMKKALEDFPLAIASGITVDNIENYLDKADCFLVATGVSRSWAELNEELVKQLVEEVRAYK